MYSVGQESLSLSKRLMACRLQTLGLIEGLSDADATVQSMEDASPAKWHLAHTSWFFEEFVLKAGNSRYKAFDERYRFLFNSYYDAVGPRHPRPLRGLLTRPSLDTVLTYRRHVDEALQLRLNHPLQQDTLDLVELGIQHEQQHQELLLTDILHLFAQNPLKPAYRSKSEEVVHLMHHEPLQWFEYPGGQVNIGHEGPGFAFDCETPRHEVLLRPFALASRLVSNGDWCKFIADEGYQTPRWWLSDGWKTVQAEHWNAPLYWLKRDGQWLQMSLAGESPLEQRAPVSHVSFYEADAYARWARKRLPTEFEWEVAARKVPLRGNFLESGSLRPLPVAAIDEAPNQPKQMFGDVWQWTASPYLAYPGFKTKEGAVGEYNGKFMSNQIILRGGSCATPQSHIRTTYRNFFYPHQRWQFAGLRLAEDRT